MSYAARRMREKLPDRLQNVLSRYDLATQL